VRWITGFNGVMIGLVYTYVLFMLFPIYNAIQALDSHQIEAAEDLGAPGVEDPLADRHSPFQAGHRLGLRHGVHVVGRLDHRTQPARLARLALVHRSRPAMDVRIADWNTGSAYAFLLLVLCTSFVTLMMRLLNVRLVDIAK